MMKIKSTLGNQGPETSVHAIIDQYSAGCLTVAAAVVSLPSRAEYQNVTLKCSIHHLKRFFPRYVSSSLQTSRVVKIGHCFWPSRQSQSSFRKNIRMIAAE
ncbi:hypothetical protein LSTR_LSTR002841 [Laodelphax striatellus]|uniref:Uncharacterized protein n=1 Tax=Laodelphax striatellus TaxID=195883 RepID=A0A482XJ77_LAOST|nr:hypothetical protein LSTR_LSTR002841 [Laodelphax striatellus]